MSSTLERIVIVGVSVAGLTAAETLRRRGFEGTISLIGEEQYQPYDRPPLSKQVLIGELPDGPPPLRNEDALQKLRLDVRLNTRAVGLDLADRSVSLRGGKRVPFDGLIIATGVTPRLLPTGHELHGVHVLRTAVDAQALRSELLPGRRLTVVGAGVLGCEVAASAQKLGLQVTVVDPNPAPMQRQLGEDLGQHVAALHRHHGVDIRGGVLMHRLLGERHVTGVELTTGEIIPTDVVLVAIGSTPATEWLSHTALDISDGVLCDHTCRAAPGVYATGDVARWWHDDLGAYIRVEHRSNAAEQAIAAATNLLGTYKPYTPVPYFWTDQYDTRIQAFGTFPPNSDTVIVRGDAKDHRFIAHCINDDRITGVIGWNMARELRDVARQTLWPSR